MAYTLRQKQSLLVKCLQKLFEYAHSQGWEFTLGDAGSPADRWVREFNKRTKRWNKRKMKDAEHMPGSLHYSRLAIDLNLFVDGKYISNGNHPAYQELGPYWESLDEMCAWGGRFGDANHFSIKHGKKR